MVAPIVLGLRLGRDEGGSGQMHHRRAERQKFKRELMVLKKLYCCKIRREKIALK